MSAATRLRDLDGVFVDPLPPPRIVRGDEQTFPALKKSYVDQMEDERDRALAQVARLERQIVTLQERLERAQAHIAVMRTPTDSDASLHRAQRVIQRQHEKIARLEASLQTDPQQCPPCIRVGRLMIDRGHRRVELDGQGFRPTAGEMLLLVHLAQHPDRVVDTYTIAVDTGTGDGNVRACFWRLKPKMASIGASDYLRSKGRGGAWGGYWMTDPETAS
jgi:hypothetical protein